MARKRKRKKAPARPADPPTHVSTSLHGAIQGWKADREAAEHTSKASVEVPRRTPDASPAEASGDTHSSPPSATPSHGDLDERAAWAKATEGVQPLSGARKKRRPDVSATPPAVAHHVQDEAARQEARARDRLDALVGGGVRFSIERDDNYVRGRRDGSSPRLPMRLGSDTCRPEARLDLHGLRAEEASRQVVRFVRAQRSRGARRVLIIHGKGHHSESGWSVLADSVLDAITEGGAAPAVEAFSTAAPVHGGSGALVVQLIRGP